MLRSAEASRRAGLFAALAFFLPCRLAAQSGNVIYIQPGVGGNLVYSVSNASGALEAIVGAQVTPTVPAGISILGDSKLGPIDVFPGYKQLFNLHYQIDPGRADGPLRVTAAYSAASGNVRPAMQLHPAQDFLVDGTAPTAAVTDLNHQPIADGAIIGPQGVFVDAADAGSGILEIDFPNFNALSFAGEHSVEGEFDDIFPGSTTVAVFDRAGNATYLNFKVDAIAPALTVTAGGAPFAFGAFVSTNAVSIVADDAHQAATPTEVVSGVAELDIYSGDPGSGGTRIGQSLTFYAASHTYTSSDLSILAHLPQGLITVVVKDKVGNAQTAAFNVVLPPLVNLSTTTSGSATYGAAGFTANVPYTSSSKYAVAQTRLYRVSSVTDHAASSFTLVSAGAPSGTFTGLSDGLYLMASVDDSGNFGGQYFQLVTTTESLAGFMTMSGVSASSYSPSGLLFATTSLPYIASNGGGVAIPVPAAQATVSYQAFDWQSSSGPPLARISTYTKTLGAVYLPVAVSTIPAPAGLVIDAGFVNSSPPPDYTNQVIVDGFQPTSGGWNGEEVRLALGGIDVGSVKFGRGGEENSAAALQGAPLPIPNPLSVALKLFANSMPLCRTQFLDAQNNPKSDCWPANFASPLLPSNNPIVYDSSVAVLSQLVGPVGDPFPPLFAYNMLPEATDISANGVSVHFASPPGLTYVGIGAGSTLPSLLPAQTVIPHYVTVQGAHVTHITISYADNETLSATVALPFDAAALTSAQLSDLRVLRTHGTDTQILTPTISGVTAAVSATTSDGNLGIFQIVRHDVAPPGPLNVTPQSATNSRLIFQWTATGDDGNVGRASNYSVLFSSTCPLTQAPSTTGPFEPGIPQPAGFPETIVFGNLLSSVTYCLAVDVLDAAGNVSGPYFSSATTLPANVIALMSADVVAGGPELELDHETSNTVTVTKEDPSAPGNGGYLNNVQNTLGQNRLSNLYTVGPSGTNFNPPARMTMRYDPDQLQANGIDPSQLKIFESIENGNVAFPIAGQSIDAIAHTITGFIGSLNSKFAIFSSTKSATPFRPGLGGLGVAADASGSLWGVAFSSSFAGIGRVDAAGHPLFSTYLPGADPDMPWSLLFDGAGNAYAVGSALAGNGADQLGVFVVSPSGTLLSSVTFDSGFNNNNLVFAAAPQGWAVGAVQTSGPISLNDSGPRSYSMAIWRLDPANGLIQLTTSYSRAGFDVATGMAVDGAGNLWVAGFSDSPSPRTSRGFDLALWKYAPDGRTLLAGPIFREGYLADFNAERLAEVSLISGTLFVAAPRGRGSPGTNMGFSLFDPGTGALLFESAWRANEVISAFPSAVLPDGQGGVLVAGGLDYGDSTSAELWRYGLGGSFVDAVQLDAGGARGAAFNAASLWLAVDGSTSPFLVSSAAATAGVFADVKPPRTFVVSGDPLAVKDAVYVASATRIGFTVMDDKLAVGDGAGAGSTQTYYSIDGSSFSLFVSSFVLASSGTHALSYFSIDLEGNAEAVVSAAVAVDSTPPVTVLRVDGVTSAATAYVVLSTDAIGLSASDSGVGVAQTFYLVDAASSACAGTPFSAAAPAGTCADPLYAGPFTLAPGTHTVSYLSTDKAQNREAGKAASFLVLPPPVSAAPPATTLVAGTPQFGAAAPFIATATPLGFIVSRPARTFFAVDSGAFAAYSGTFTLVALGTHTIQFYSVGALGDAEVARSSAVAVDGLPPRTAVAFGDPKFAGARLYLGAAAPVLFGAIDDLAVAGDGRGAGVAQTLVAVDSAAYGTAAAAITFSSEGVHALSWFSRDQVGNTELAASTSVAVDLTPPVTQLLISSPSVTQSSGTVVGPATVLSLSALDPLSGGVAAGVKDTFLAVSTGVFTLAPASFTLTGADGPRAVSFYSRDNVLNAEAVKTAAVLLDATAPVTAFQASGAYYAAGGRSYAPLSFTYALPAQDPAVNGAASGVAATSYRVDAGAFARYVSTFSLSEGVRQIAFLSTDNVGNQELLKSATVYVDATAPVTTLSIGQPQYAAPSGTLFVGPAATYALSSQDPVVQSAASGVGAVSVRVDSAPFAAYSATFTLTPGDGLRTVGWFAADNVGNAETPKVSTVALDATPPVTSLLIAGGRQFAGPDAVTFYASSDTRLVLISTDPAANGAASGMAFTQWQDNNGAFQTYLSSLAFAEGAHRLSYQSADNVANLETPRSTNVWVDATPPVTTVSVGSPIFTALDGTIYVATATPIAFSAVDPPLPTGQPGSGVSRIEVAVDSAPFAPYAASLTLAEGRHMILYRAVDNVGNVETTHSISLQSDATPPASSLVIGAPQFQLPGVLLVSSRTPFSITAADPMSNNVASGVKDTYYRVSDVSPSTSAFAAFAAPFALAGSDANKAIEFFSRDNVLNTEVVKSSAVLLDSTPPEIALLSPAACDSGICRALKGKFSVLGTAHDNHFGNYVLDYAPGQSATTGYALISSGTVAVSSGPLGVWDATRLSGWLTLRLTATDLVQNVSALTLNVFAGDPGELLRLGDHEVFDMPEGVAVGGDGKIYVADRNNDRVAVFSSTGTMLASFGGRRGGHDDDGRASTTTVRLNKPSGVAVDAIGNIYVADTQNDRVLELSATGQLLLTLGARPRDQEGKHEGRHEDSDEHGRRKPGQFRHPAGVAVDAAGSIYVADTENRRVQVFSSTGGFHLQFDLPAVPARPDHDDGADQRGDRDGGADIAALGKPFAVALDAAGNIYVADPKGSRALKFGATGQLLLTIPIAGDKPGSLGQPFGVAVSTSGECMLVSDRKNSRVLKFDFSGTQNLSFGAKGRLRDDTSGAAVVFNKPMGLALDAAGNLYVSDRNNDRVREFSLPTGRPPLVVPPPKPEGDHTARDVVDREDGGKVERRDRAAVDIPAGAVAQDLKVTVGAPSAGADDDSSRRRAVEDKRLKAASAPVEYGPEGTQFQTPVTLTLPYSPELAALQGVDESDLKVHYWNRDKGQWQDLDSVVDPKTRTVKAKTTHFSLYQVFSGTVSAAALSPLAADPTFGFKTAYAFPNPAHNAVTIRVQPGQADSVSVRIYDQAGRMVHQSANFAGSTLDDGNGLGPQFTYDHVWDLSGVGSGVYSYALTATKAGQADIHRTGRLAVVK